MSKKLKKMPQLRGNIPAFYSRETVREMCITINALAQAIDCLAERVEELERRLQTDEI